MLRIGAVGAVVLGGLAVAACRGEVLLGGEQADGGVEAGGAVSSTPVDAGASSGGSSSSGGASSGASSGGGSSGSTGSCSVPAAGSGSTGTPVLLASVQVPAGIAVDDKNVYWASYEIGPVGAVPIAGGPSTTLDDISATTIAIDGTRVYTVSPSGGNAPQGLVVACDKAGCGGNPTTIASGQNGVWGIAVDDANVYWTIQGIVGGSGPGVFKAPLAGGNPTALATGVSATSIAVGGGNVYFSGVASNGYADLMMVPVSGGAPTTLVANPNSGVNAIATDCSSVYFTTSDGTIAKMPLGGGPSTTLTSVAGNVSQLAVDAARVYWADAAGGAIGAVPIDGGVAEILVTGQAVPIGVAVDSHYVYWANRDGTPSGSIMRVSK